MKYSASATGFKFIFLFAVILLASCSRGGDGVPALDPDFVGTDDPDRFLQFLNRQEGLGAGSYRIIAGTQNVGESGDFTITLTRDDGHSRTFSGSWTLSDGMSAVPGGGNPDFGFTMPYSGGARIKINSNVATCLYLLDSGGEVRAGQYDVGGADEDLCSNPASINMPTSRINLAANAQAYYRAIDPDNTRTTLDDWKRQNGFGQPCPASTPNCERHVIFRDTKDLGYGRDMYARMERNPDNSLRRFAVFVRNFRVDALPGLQYSTLNLDAAIANNEDPAMHDNIQWHFGSNAIEFSSYPYGVGEPSENYAVDNLTGGVYPTNDGTAPLYAKFFTFRPDDVNDPNTTERRLDTVNLDSRGYKSMPGPCIACHGGMSRPLLPNGELPAPIPGGIPGDTQSQMQVIEVSTVTFSDVPGWTCGEIISDVNFVNQGVLSTYEAVEQQYGGVLGYWQPDFAADLIEGWYGEDDADHGDFSIPDRGCNYLQNHFYDYVPPGWRPDPNTGTPPAGADDLFREVIAPNCMVCHSRRGVNLGPNQQPGVRQDIDFSSYERFMSHAEQIERFIFHKGVMPLGILNFDAFWDNSGPGRAELLASHLPDFDSFKSDGTVRRPGKPYAVIAAPRNTNVPAIVSAEGSSFASSYQWSIVSSPVGSNPTLTNANRARAVFDTDMNGEYRLRLVVRKNGVQSPPVTAFIAVSNLLPLPANLRYESSADPDENIKFVLQNNPLGAVCADCHASEIDGGQAGVPVYYTDSQVEGRDRYRELLQRINFKEPVESPLLRKPSGNHHFGSLVGGFDLEGNRYNYDLFLNWILHGAPR